MRLGKYLSSRTMSELEELKAELNLTDEEEIIFDELRKGRSNVVVADKVGIATSTLSLRIKDISEKCSRVVEGK